MSDSLAGVPDVQLFDRIQELVRRGNVIEAELLAHLAEVDARQLCLEEGCSSMFAYCQRVLHFAEAVAYKRIQAARAARRFPQLLGALRSGELHLTAVSLIASKLSEANCMELIAAARHLGADDIKRLLADRDPRPAVPSSIRSIVQPTKVNAPVIAAPASTLTVRSAPAPPPSPKAWTEPLGAERYRVQFTANSERVAASREKPSRHIPAAIKRAVWTRDGGRCSYISPRGRPCNSKDFLEFDHVKAWVWTHSHSITLRCRAHNQRRAREDFGEDHIARLGRNWIQIQFVAPRPE